MLNASNHLQRLCLQDELLLTVTYKCSNNILLSHAGGTLKLHIATGAYNNNNWKVCNTTNNNKNETKNQITNPYITTLQQHTLEAI